MGNCFINFGQTKEVDEFIISSNDENFKVGYWLRTPYPIARLTNPQIGNYAPLVEVLEVPNEQEWSNIPGDIKDFQITRSGAGANSGIRPAFYLNEENAQILSGNGTKEDPYVIDGRDVPERFEKNGLYGYKDRDGKVVIEAKYSKALPFSDGAALVATTEDPYRWRYIDTDGNYLFDKAFYASNNFNSGYALVLVSDEPTYRYIDKTGEWANDLIFEDAEDFGGGYASVKMNGKWGIVDTMFNFTVPCNFETKEEASAHFGE